MRHLFTASILTAVLALTAGATNAQGGCPGNPPPTATPAPVSPGGGIFQSNLGEPFAIWLFSISQSPFPFQIFGGCQAICEVNCAAPFLPVLSSSPLIYTLRPGLSGVTMCIQAATLNSSQGNCLDISAPLTVTIL